MWATERAKITRGATEMTKLDIALYLIIIGVVVVGVIGFVIAARKDDEK